MTATRRRAPALTIAAGLIATSGAAVAETSPWYLGISQAFGYDSNIFRRADEAKPESSGLISTTRLLGGFDIVPSRQHIYANVSLNANRYGDQPQLDSNGYGIAAGWDWETLERLSGVIKIAADRKPGNYADPQVPGGTGRVLDEPLRADFIVRLGDWKHSRMWLEGGYFYTRTTNLVDFGATSSVLGFQAEGYDRRIPTHSVSGGVRYRQGGNLIVGVDLRLEKGEEEYKLRNPAVAPPGRLYNDYDRQDIDLIARWTASGASNVDARLSYTRTENTGTLGRTDYSGTTATAAWEWQATGKLRSVARVAYDTDVREETIGDSTATTTNPAWSLAWDLTWNATAKLTPTLAVRWSDRKHDTALLDDQRQSLTLGLAYAALRNVTFNCSVGRESRHGAGAQRDYDATMTSCSVQAMLR
jgi:hypothetical protein